MATLWLVVLCTCISLCFSLSTVLVTEFSASKEEEGLLSLLRSINFARLQYGFSFPIAVCYYDGLVSEPIRNEFIDVEWVEGSSINGLYGKDWNALSCSLYVAQLLFSKGQYNTDIVYLGSNLVANIDLISSEFMAYTKSRTIMCYPRRFTNVTIRGTCELDYFRMKASTGALVRSTLQALNNLPLSANDALDLAISQLHLSLSFFPADSVLRPLAYVNGPTDAAVDSFRLMEIDGVNHRITLNRDSCTLSLYVEWPEFGAIPVLVDGLRSIIENEERQQQFVGCLPMPRMDRPVLSLVDLPAQQTQYARPHKVFDCILFFDEISLLLLRLELLKDVVDLHILVEAPKTFTGKVKPLYFQESEELFAAYRHKILVVTLEDLPTPSAVGEVWRNEYESRNALAEGLLAVNATDDDVILVADTDEMIDPEAIKRMLAILRYNDFVRGVDAAKADLTTSSDSPHTTQRGSYGDNDLHLLPEYYKLFQDQYLYNFNCSLDDIIAKESRASITTVREARRISHLRSASRSSGSMTDWSRKYPYYLIDARNHMSNAPVFPLSQLLSPGGVHLSFFESVERIKRKLESYSHQNFASQFHESESTASTHVDGTLKYDLSNKDSLPVGEVSVSSLMSRIQQGEVINFKNRKQNMKCNQKTVTNGFVKLVKEKWDAMARDEDIVHL